MLILSLIALSLLAANGGPVHRAWAVTLTGLGRDPSPQEVGAWAEEALPNGRGLPEGSGDVATGATVFARSCAGCHGAEGEGASAAPLVHGPETVLGYRIGRSPTGEPRPTWFDFYPFATTLFDYVRNAMPFDAPGSLSTEQVYSVVAWVLARNGLLPANASLDRSALLRVKLPALSRFFYDGGAVTTW